MKEMTLKEIQKAELELLVKFDALCGENDIKYSLHGGTLLGAVRHKGFIPWDDDVDVMMLRPEYEKFIELCKRIKTDFRLVNNETDPGFSFAFSKISNENTVLKGIHRLGMKHGLYIDIIPIDYIGKDTEYIKSLKKELDHVHALSMRKRNSFFHYFFMKCGMKDRILYLKQFVLSRRVSSRELIRRLTDPFRQFTADNSEYVCQLTSKNYLKRIFRKSVFEKYDRLEFEGFSFSVVKDYDFFLREWFGDYMKLPPEEERVPRHSFRVYNK